jgi:hypothetical protein
MAGERERRAFYSSVVSGSVPFLSLSDINIRLVGEKEVGRRPKKHFPCSRFFANSFGDLIIFTT